MKLACSLAVLGALAGLAPAAPALRDSEVPPGQLRFRGFGASEGLHNLVVVSIAQDPRGYLWVGTEDGIDRYDGDHFTHFGLEQGLISTWSRVLGVGPDGKLCAGGTVGLVCFDGTRFHRVSSIPEVAVTGIGTANNRLWVATAGGLYVRDGGDFSPAPGWPASEAVEAMWADAHGVIVAGQAGIRSSTGDGAWHPLPLVTTSEHIDDVLREPGGTVWVRSAHHLWRLSSDGHDLDDFGEGLPLNYVASGQGSMTLDAYGTLLLATDKGVAYRKGERWLMINSDRGGPFSGARTVYRDNAGTLWVGAVGLYQWRGRGLIERFDQPSGMPGNVVWSIARDRDGALWAGTDQCLAHMTFGSWKCLPGTEHHVARGFVFPPQGGAFVGGLPAELLYIDPAGKVTALPYGDPHVTDRAILALALGPEGDLWIATRAGLFRLPHATPGPIHRVTIPGAAADTRVSSLVVADGTLWAGTSDGLAAFNSNGWRLFGVAQGLLSSSVRYLARRHDGGMCTTYTEAIGASCFEVRGDTLDKLVHLGLDSGLSSGAVYFIGDDRRGRLWLGTGDGVTVVTPGGMERFTETDGLAGDDSAATAFLADTDGSLWFGASGGLSRFHGERYTGPPPPPKARLHAGTLGLHVFREHAPYGLETRHDQNALRIELGADTLVDESRLDYQVRLTPIDTDWTVSTGRELNYPSLLPGNYQLQVRARVAPGDWGPITTMTFVVNPAWWQTRGFVVLVGSSLLLVLGLIALLSQRAAVARRTRQLNERSIKGLRALVEHIPDLISVHSGDRVVYCNAAARRVYGFESDTEVSGLGDRVHPDDVVWVAAVMRVPDGAAAPGIPEMVELRVRDDHGGHRICEVSGVWMELVDDARMLVVCGRDVTERNELRAQLLVSDRMASLGTLAAGIAHEINNPLAYTLGNLQLVNEALEAPDGRRAELKVAVTDAIDGAERVRKIVQGLRSFSRAEEEQRVRLDLPDVLRAAIRLTHNEIRHRAKLELQLGPTPKVVADDGRLTQVFINLIVNASHAIPEGRTDNNTITVRTRTDEAGQAVIEVIDTGSGMATEVLARVFDPFYTTKAVGSGTGLGLSICHGIVTALGGTIEIESAIARGTTVRVSLPAAAATTTMAAIVRRTTRMLPTQPARLRVLLVDDEPQVVEMLARMLRREHDVVAVSCGRAAIEQIDQGNWFDAIVSDVMMPNMTGLELLEELVKLAPEQAKRLIFLSGGVFTPETRARLDDLGTVQLEKPISTKDLRQIVMKVAAAPKAGAA